MIAAHCFGGQGLADSIDDPLGAFVPGTEVDIAGAEAGPLQGVRFAAKDIYDVAGHVTGCGNPDWARSQAPASDHAWAVRALLEAGAHLVGKAITDEFAYSLNGMNHHYGAPTNSNAPGRITGGSSSGSASAVAGGAVETALGSDTGGSVRIPASYCGLYGIRTTHGRVSLEGVMPLAPTLDTVGWFARDADLLRRVGDVLLGADSEASARPRRLLIAEDAFALADAGVGQALAGALQRLEARFGGGERIRVGEPGGGLESWVHKLRAILIGEAWLSHGAWIESAKPSLGPEIARNFAAHSNVSAEDLAAARADRGTFIEHLSDLLEGPETLLCLPSAPSIAPLLSSTSEELATQRLRVHSLTCTAGLSGFPQVSLPLGEVEGCPVGLSLIALAGQDQMLLSFVETFAREPGEDG